MRSKTEALRADLEGQGDLHYVKKCMEIAVDEKAYDVCAYDLRQISSLTDYALVLSGTSRRHVGGVVDKIRRALRKLGRKQLSIDGQGSDWVVMDYGSFMLHIFYEAARQYYDIDGIWKEAKKIELDQALEERAKKLGRAIDNTDRRAQLQIAEREDYDGPL